MLIEYITAFLIITVVALLPSQTMKSTKSEWYKCIRPAITPPNFVFPIVWTFLYILIAIVLAHAIKARHQTLLLFFAVNLALNVLWSFLYFGSKRVALAFVVLLTILATGIVIFYLSWSLLPKWVTWLFLPYLLWLAFAGVLNGLSLSKKC